MKLGSKICVVTGGLSGLGLATTETLAKLGAHVAILDLNDSQGVARRLGSQVRFFQGDVSKTEQIESAVQGITAWAKEIGEDIAAVVCCAGILGPAKILGRQNIPFSIETFQKVIAVNLVGTVDVIRQLLPHMAIQTPNYDGERGVIITVASAAAFDGQPGQVAYSATKGAIASMTLPLARDLAQHGIRVVSISPGMFETSMTTNMPKKAKESLQRVLEFPNRPGRPDEFADLVVHSVSNSMLNGTVLRLDGATRMPSRL